MAPSQSILMADVKVQGMQYEINHPAMWRPLENLSLLMGAKLGDAAGF
jgi:hypothetical protein